MDDQPPRPCATPHSAPVAWLRACPDPIEGSEPPPIDEAALRAAIKLVLSSPEAVAEVVGAAPPSAFAQHVNVGGTRHDGWNNERMATFLEVLAVTGLITEACRASGMSRDAAYSLRDRDSVFAAALRAAQAKARPLIADGMLERSINGTVEHYYRDGVLVGERRHYESWLALAVLRRLDKQAEDDRAEGAMAAGIENDWQEVVDALRSGGTSAVPALLKAKADKAYIPPPPSVWDDPEGIVWKTQSGVWMTIFPPPPGFDGDQNRPFDALNWYERSCTAEEVELIEAGFEAEAAQECAELTAEAEAQREKYFNELRAILNPESANE